VGEGETFPLRGCLRTSSRCCVSHGSAEHLLQLPGSVTEVGGSLQDVSPARWQALVNPWLFGGVLQAL